MREKAKRKRGKMGIELVPAYPFKEEVRELFTEYTDLVIQQNPDFAQYLAAQHYEKELEQMEIKYGMPSGRLFLAFYEKEPAGCIGLRKLDETNCEMKRLYVKPAFRGKRIGESLVEEIIRSAREIGYSHMLLDTFPFLRNAISLYRKYGFYEIESYNNSPMENLVYMRLEL